MQQIEGVTFYDTIDQAYAHSGKIDADCKLTTLDSQKNVIQSQKFLFDNCGFGDDIQSFAVNQIYFDASNPTEESKGLPSKA